MKLEGPRKQIALGFSTVWVWDTHVNRAYVRTHRGVIEPDALGAETGINLVDAVSQADGRIGACRHTGVTADALLGDQDGHRLPVLPASSASLSGILLLCQA